MPTVTTTDMEMRVILIMATLTATQTAAISLRQNKFWVGNLLPFLSGSPRSLGEALTRNLISFSRD
jgi:hypothetical protein